MKKYVKKYKALLILSVIFSMLTSISNIVLSYSMGIFTNYATNQNLSKVIFWSLATVFSLIISGIFQASDFALKANFSKNAILALKKDLYNYLVNMPISKRKNEDTAGYISLVQVDSEMIQKSYFENICSIFGLIIKIVLSSIALFYISYKIFIVFILISAFTTLIIPIFKKNLSNKKVIIATKANEYIKTIKDFLLGLDVLIFNLKEKNELKKLEKIDSDYENSKKNSKIWEVNLSISSISVGMLSQMLCMIFAAYLISKGELSVGLMITSTQLLNFIVPPVSTLNNRITEFKSIKNIIKKFEDLIKEDIKEKVHNYENGDIVYRNFSINGVHNNFNYTLQKGKHYVILGKTGSGKSLLMKSLIRKFEDYRGEILINGINVRDIKREELYKNIKYSSQEGHIFDVNILENISLGDKIDVKDMILKLELDNIDLSKENLNENLSGGEKQRINLARVLAKDADIYIFDEPTSALDPNTSKIIEKMINELKNKTVIVISHNWDEKYLENFDEIIKI